MRRHLMAPRATSGGLYSKDRATQSRNHFSCHNVVEGKEYNHIQSVCNPVYKSGQVRLTLEQSKLPADEKATRAKTYRVINVIVQ
jgi:hypothetical protein